MSPRPARLGDPPPSVMEILDALRPLLESARVQGWAINLAVEQDRDGERFTVSGDMPRDGK